MDKAYNKDNVHKEEQIDENMGLSDIIDILNTLDYNSPGSNETLTTCPINNINNSHTMSMPSPTSDSSSPSTHRIKQNHSPDMDSKLKEKSEKLEKPYIKIVEQPANKALRFRYECEGRSAGSIPGANSTSEIKTYPVIEIANYKGEVTLVVSCVTKDPPYRPHPHNLVGKEGCVHGVYTVRIKGDPPRAILNNLGVQCVRRKDIKAALELRESKNIDPFKTKFAHKDQPSSIDLNVVRLCFQAFIQTGPRQFKKLQPVVSEPVYDRKAVSNLAINRLCSCSAKVSGGDEIIMLCEKVTKDIKIKFYELNKDGYEIWHDYAEFHHSDIHKNTAIAFKTPRYPNATDITQRIQVYIQLERPSDGATSEPLPFEYYPDQGRRSLFKCNLHFGQLQQMPMIHANSTTLNTQFLNCMESGIMENISKTKNETKLKDSEIYVKYPEENTIDKTLEATREEFYTDQLILNQIAKWLQNDVNDQSKITENNSNAINLNTMDSVIPSKNPMHNSYNYLSEGSVELDDSFNETASYASLQMALKHPMDIPDKTDAISDEYITSNISPKNLKSLNDKIPLSYIKLSLLPKQMLSKYNKTERQDDDIVVSTSSAYEPSPSKKCIKSSKRKHNFISYIISRLNIKKDLLSSQSNETLNSKDTNLSSDRKCGFRKFWSLNRNHCTSRCSVKSLQFARKHDTEKILINSNPNLHTAKQFESPKSDYTEHLQNALKSHNDFHINNIPLLDGQMELIAIADRENIINLCQSNNGIALDPNVNLNEAEYFALYATMPHSTNNNLSMEFEKCELLTPEEVAKRLAILNDTYKAKK